MQRGQHGLSYWVALYRHRYVILLVAVLTAVIATLASFMLPPVFEAKTVFFVPDGSLAVSFLSDDTTRQLATDSKLPPIAEVGGAPYLGLLKTKTIAERVHARFPAKPIAKMLRSDVDYELTDEYMIILYSRDRDPVLAANCANAYVEELNVLLNESSRASATEDAALIQRELDDSLAKLTEAEAALVAFETEHAIPSVQEQVKQLSDLQSQLDLELEQARAAVTQGWSRIATLSTQLGAERDLLSQSSYLLETPAIGALRTRAAELSAQLSRLGSELGPRNPEWRAIATEYRAVSNQLHAAVAQTLDGAVRPADTKDEQIRRNLLDAHTDLAMGQARVEGIGLSIAGVRQSLARFPDLIREDEALRTRVATARQLAEHHRASLREMELQSQRQIAFTRVVEPSAPPTAKSFPIFWLNGLVGLIVGSIVGVLYALMLGGMERARTLGLIQLARAIDRG